MVHRPRVRAATGAAAVLLGLWTFGAPGARAQDVSADSLVVAADRAAREDEHAQALRLYHKSIARDSTLADRLSAKVARQYLWAGETAKALRWFERFTATGQKNCGVWLDYGLALTWAGRLDRAARQYEKILGTCPASYDREAQLGLARLRRWQAHYREAGRLYAAVSQNGTPAQRQSAAVGLGHLRRARGEPRRAVRQFRGVLAQDSSSAAAVEGLAQAYMDLGLDGRARSVLAGAERRDLQSGGLVAARRRLDARQSVGVQTAGSAFEDSDGTESRAGRLLLTLPLGPRTELALSGERFSVDRSGSRTVSSAGLRLGHRFSAALAVRGAAYRHRYDGETEDLTTGFGTLVWTPSDRVRIRSSAGRTWLPDNFAAVRERVTGTFGSMGLTVGLGSYTALELSGQRTRFSDQRHRTRGTLRFTHSYEGVPSLTLEWPTTVQRYDNPFPFALWSPEFYVESGPGVSLYWRMAPDWHLNLYGRGGIQSETGLAPRTLGQAWGRLSWSFSRGSEFWGQVSWSNSSLGGALGFRRTAVEGGLTVRF